MGAGRSRTGVAGGKPTLSSKGGAGGGGSSSALDDYGVTDSDIMKKTFGNGWESLNFDEILEKKGFSVPQNCILKTDKIQALGWQGKYKLRDGLESTINILREAEK